MIKQLKPGKIYFECGPVQMVISAFRGDEPLHEEMLLSARYAENILTELSSNLHLVKRSGIREKLSNKTPSIVKKMMEAVMLAGDGSLMPMASVAGAFSDEVADYLCLKGATRVFVNNGGDIALRLTGNDCIKVGINSSLQDISYRYILNVQCNDEIGGIATSGLGGRGLTKGIASAATVLARNSSIADACATLIANNTNCDHSGIERCLAEKIDPLTDIKGHLITVRVNSQNTEVFSEAIQNGVKKAKQLYQENIILGSLIFAGPFFLVYPDSLNEKLQAKSKAVCST